MNYKLKEILSIVIGNFILALGISAFIIPSGLISGGATGIGLTIYNFTGIKVYMTVYVINIVMFIIGYKVLGKEFAKKTLLSTIIYPTFLALLSNVPSLQHLTSDTLLSTIYAGIFIGIGMGMVLRIGASTGGMDIPPLIINKKTGLSVPIVLNGIDAFIILCQTSFSSIEQVLYGIVVIIVTTIIMDKLMIIGQSSLQVMIISPKYYEIRDVIFSKIDRGCTFVDVTTGYKEEKQFAVMVVISKRDLKKLTELVLEIDETAFIITNETHSVKGRGFTLPSNE